MRALRVRHHGEPTDALTLEEVPEPTPDHGQVAMRVGAAALGLPDVLLGRAGTSCGPRCRSRRASRRPA